MPQIKYVLDTDTVTFQQSNRPSVLRRLTQVDPTIVATTVITMYEQLRGRLAAINRQQNDQSRQLAYLRLQQTHGYFCRVPVLAFDADAVDIYSALMRQGLRIGAQDLLIAAITLSQQATLVTSNRRHFDQIPRLTIEDWGI